MVHNACPAPGRASYIGTVRWIGFTFFGERVGHVSRQDEGIAVKDVSGAMPMRTTRAIPCFPGMGGDDRNLRRTVQCGPDELLCVAVSAPEPAPADPEASGVLRDSLAERA